MEYVLRQPPTKEQADDLVEKEVCFNRKTHILRDNTLAFTYNYFMPHWSNFCQNRHEQVEAENPVWKLDPHASELRGLTFLRDHNDSSAYTRWPMFPKFFTLNQCPMSEPEFFSHDKIVRVDEKLDGSLLSFVKTSKGNWFPKTQNCFDNIQTSIASSYVFRYPRILRVLETMHDYGIVLLFELISPWNQVVVKYDSDALVLIGGRQRGADNRVLSPDYLQYMYGTILKNSIPEILIPQKHDLKSIDEAINSLVGVDDREGVVITYESGHKLKIKAPIYCEKHRHMLKLEKARMMLASNKKLVRLFSEQQLEDIISELKPIDPEFSAILDVKQSTMRAEFFRLFHEFRDLAKKWPQFSMDPSRKFHEDFQKEAMCHAVLRFKQGKRTEHEAVMEYFFWKYGNSAVSANKLLGDFHEFKNREE